MGKRAHLIAVVAFLGISLAAPVLEAGAANRTKVRLAAFRSCAALVQYAQRFAARGDDPSAMPPRTAIPFPATGGPERTGTGDPAPAPASAPGASEDTSPTNVQEAGVDEPDIVKVRNGRVFAIAGGKLHAVDVRSGAPRLLDSLQLEGSAHELLLHDERLLVVSQSYGRFEGGATRAASAPSIAPVPIGQAETILSEVDAANPAALRIVRTQEVDGAYVSARLTGRSARVVVSTTPRAFVAGEPALRRRLAGWMPRSRLENRRTRRRSTRAVASCRAVRRPVTFSGLSMVTVLTVDLDKGLPAIDADALMSDAQIVYASPRSLYVATQRFLSAPDSGTDLPPPLTTAIHRFDTADPDTTRYRASGQVPGYLLNQFSMSEHAGELRIASTDSPVWWNGGARTDSQSHVTVLDERDGRLAEIGRVSGLGKGERIYAVRFLGDTGYVVTFRQVDPLYTIDLENPTRPRVAGELKILGYSAYLHPVSEGLLLGVGQDATEQGRLRGSQLSLFDVSDPRNPRRLHQRAIGSGSSSEVEYDHHAFLWWAPAKLAVIPVTLYAERVEGRPFLGAVGFRVDRAAGIAEAGRASHDLGRSQELGQYPYPVRRALVVRGRLVTVSEIGLEVGVLATLAEQGFVAFPPPPRLPGPEPQPAR
jgi:hypothetical protein